MQYEVGQTENKILTWALTNLLNDAHDNHPDIYRKCVTNNSTDVDDHNYKSYFSKALRCLKAWYNNPITVHWSPPDEFSGLALPFLQTVASF